MATISLHVLPHKEQGSPGCWRHRFITYKPQKPGHHLGAPAKTRCCGEGSTELHFLPALAAAQQLFPVYLLYYFLGYTSRCSQLNPCVCHPTAPRLARGCRTAAQSRVRTPKARLSLAGQGLLSVVAPTATSTALQKVPCGTRDTAPSQASLADLTPADQPNLGKPSGFPPGSLC